MFCPERFEDGIVDVCGHDFQLLPFGSGRRICPGIHLGVATAQFVVAQLMHCINWKLPDGMSPDDLDMSEKFELTMPRSQPLLAVPTYHLNF
jgi:cytochrome P450